MSLTLQFTGTGTSVGVPQIGCSCPTCTSTDPRDKRRRSGAYVRCGGFGILVDTPPEMRLSAIEYGITRVDAVVLTHAHMDHVAGFDDVRRFNTLNGHAGADGRIIGEPLPCYAATETIDAMKHIFPYVGTAPNREGLFRPQIEYRPVADAFVAGPVRVTPLPVEHGPRTNGYLFEEVQGKGIAWISDCAAIPEETRAKIRGVDTLVLDCLRERFHPTHLNLEASLAVVADLKPRRTYFVHMCHDVKHDVFSRKLPSGVELAYDGLEVHV